MPRMVGARSSSGVVVALIAALFVLLIALEYTGLVNLIANFGAR